MGIRYKKRGELFLNAMRDCGFRNLNSFYKYKSVNTWASTFNNLVFTLDHLLERPQGKKLTIIDTKVITKGTQSDHLPVCLILKICVKRRAQGKHAHPKLRLKRTAPKSSIDYKEQTAIPHHHH
jgi:hypothetical protein